MIQSGIIVLNKPQDATSHDSVGMIRRLVGTKKVGHGGTLDPMATGVLPIFIGKATRVIEYMSESSDDEAKIYRATMRLGYETDTQDILGEEIWRDEENHEFPPIAQIEAIFNDFVGEQMQIPPAYSAVKYKGKRLYEYAREGKAIEDRMLKSRTIYVKYMHINKCDPGAMEIEFDIACSGGTYIRTICQGVGRKLGNGAVMSKLIRLKSGPFRIEDSYTIEELQELKERGADIPMLPIDSAIPALKKLVVSNNSAKKFANGLAIGMDECQSEEMDYANDETYVAVYDAELFIGIARCKDGTIKPHKVII